MSDGKILVARETFTAELDGSPVIVHKGVTRVREGHPLLKGREDLFELVDDTVHYDIEQATAAPGEKRGQREPDKLNQRELKAELDKLGIEYPKGPVKNEVLRKLLEDADAKPAEGAQA